MTSRDEPVALRLAMPSDLAAIDAIERACFGNPWPLDAYAQELESRHGPLEVAIVGGRLVGYSCIWHVLDEAHLMRLATDPTQRRRGVARRLMAAGLARAQDARCTVMTLEVGSQNVAAVTLYTSFGFAEIGRRRGYYRSPPDDAIVMRRPVVEPS